MTCLVYDLWTESFEIFLLSFCFQKFFLILFCFGMLDFGNSKKFKDISRGNLEKNVQYDKTLREK